MDLLKTVGVVNQSTVVTADQAAAIAEACNAQVRADYCPAFGVRLIPVRYYTTLGRVADTAAPLVILDDADQAGALGYHDETPDGRVYARVFARTILAAGGGVLAGSLYSVSATVSHEVLELLRDPTCEEWVESETELGEVATEVGDPVENGSYKVPTARHGDVAVSNFVYPRWFDPKAPHTAQFDHLRQVSRPFAMTRGGYLITRKGGTITEHYGDEVPAWRRQAKQFPAARTARRLAGDTRPPVKETAR